jgi:hypothetical protein
MQGRKAAHIPFSEAQPAGHSPDGPVSNAEARGNSGETAFGVAD